MYVSLQRYISYQYIDGLVQDYSYVSALAMELLQPYTKPSIFSSTEIRAYTLKFRSYVVIFRSPLYLSCRVHPINIFTVCFALFFCVNIIIS